MKHYKLLLSCLMILVSLIGCHPEHTEMGANVDNTSTMLHTIRLNIKQFTNASDYAAETRTTDVMQVADLWMLVFTDSTDEGELVQKVHFSKDQITENSINVDLVRPAMNKTYHALFLANAPGALAHLDHNDIMVVNQHRVKDLRDFLNEDHDDGNGQKHDHRILVEPANGPEQKIGEDWYIPSCSKWIQIEHNTQPGNIGENGVIDLHPRVSRLTFHMKEDGITIHSVRVVNIPKYFTASDLGEWKPGIDPTHYYDLKAHSDLGGTASYFIANDSHLEHQGEGVDFSCYLPSTGYGTIQANEEDFENGKLKGTAYPVLEVKLSTTSKDHTFYIPIGEEMIVDGQKEGHHVKEGMHYKITLNEEDFAAVDYADAHQFVRFYGNEYINLGFAPKDHMYFRIKASVDGGLTQDSYLFGAKNNNNACAINYKNLGSDQDGYWRAEVNNFSSESRQDDLNNPGHVMTIDLSVENFQMKAEEEPDIDEVETNQTSFGTIKNSLILGGLNTSTTTDATTGNFSNGFKGDIYSIEGWMTDRWGWGEKKFIDLVPSKLGTNSIGFKDKQNGNTEYAKLTTPTTIPAPTNEIVDDNDDNEKYVTFDGSHYVDLGIPAKEAYNNGYVFYIRLASNSHSSNDIILGAREKFKVNEFSLVLLNTNQFRGSINAQQVYLNKRDVVGVPITINMSCDSLNYVTGFYNDITQWKAVKEEVNSFKQEKAGVTALGHHIYLGGLNYVEGGTRKDYYCFKGKIIYLVCLKPLGNGQFEIIRSLEPDTNNKADGGGCKWFIDTANGNKKYELLPNA